MRTPAAILDVDVMQVFPAFDQLRGFSHAHVLFIGGAVIRALVTADPARAIVARHGGSLPSPEGGATGSAIA